jgi:RHS repeat-associated protein
VANVSLTPRYHSYGRSRFGIDYAINRYYDPETGRFLQPDPLGQAVYRAEDPQSLNLYSFAGNDPINRRDPLGLRDDIDCTQTIETGGWCGGEYYVIGRIDSQSLNEYVDDLLPGRAPYSPSINNVKDDDRDTRDAIDKRLTDLLRRQREKAKKCGDARTNFAAAATAYARVSATVRMHNLLDDARADQVMEWAADSFENLTEQMEDFSPLQAGAAGTARFFGYRSLQKQREAMAIDQALLQGDQRAAIAAMKSTAETRDAACK